MLTRHIALVLLIAGTAAAADVRLGSEVPVVPIRTGSAAWEQSLPAVASNGRDFLAIWNDSRERTQRPWYYTSRLDSSGVPAEPFGRRFQPAIFRFPALIASNGEDYLAAWYDESSQATLAQHLDENGAPAGPARVVRKASPISLASDGLGYLLVFHSQESGYVATALDRDGSVRGTLPLQLSEYLSLDAAGGTFGVLGFENGCCYCLPPCSGPVLRTIDARGETMVMTTTALPEESGGRGFIVKSSPNRILVSWVLPLEENQVWFTMLDRSGKVIQPATKVNLASLYAFSIRNDGDEFLLFSPGDSRAVHIRPNGAVVNSVPYSVPETAQFASNGSALLMLWERGGDIVSRSLRGFDDLAVRQIDGTVVASSGRAQDRVRIARAGSHEMIVWRDDATGEIAGSLDGVEVGIYRGLAVGIPSVTAGARTFLVAWNEVNNAQFSARMLARRYAFDGTLLDKTPIELASGTYTELDDDPGVTADGSSFVISVGVPQAPLRLLRLDGETGALSELLSYPCGLCRAPFRPVPTTSGWMIPYLRYVGFFSPHVSVTWGVSIAETTLSGTPVREVVTPFTGMDSYCAGLGIAQAGDQVSVALPSFAGIRIVRAATGVPADPITVPNTADAAGADLAWNGSEYVLAWTTTNGGPIRAMRFDADFHALDAASFEIAAGGSTTAGPSIAVTGQGVVIAYSRSTAENGYAPRAFTRTLDRLSSPIVRRRGVRH